MSGGDQGWQVGDLALRLGEGRDWYDVHLNVSDSEGSPPGSVNRVITVCREPEGLGLRFEDWPRYIFSASSFRKIAPHTPDAEDAETIALLNGQPASPAPARTPEPVS